MMVLNDRRPVKASLDGIALGKRAEEGEPPSEASVEKAKPRNTPDPEDLGVEVVYPDSGGHVVLPAEAYCEEDDAYDGLCPAP